LQDRLLHQVKQI